MVTWGSPEHGGNSDSVQQKLAQAVRTGLGLRAMNFRCLLLNWFRVVVHTTHKRTYGDMGRFVPNSKVNLQSRMWVAAFGLVFNCHFFLGGVFVHGDGMEGSSLLNVLACPFTC